MRTSRTLRARPSQSICLFCACRLAATTVSSHELVSSYPLSAPGRSISTRWKPFKQVRAIAESRQDANESQATTIRPRFLQSAAQQRERGSSLQGQVILDRRRKRHHEAQPRWVPGPENRRTEQQREQQVIEKRKNLVRFTSRKIQGGSINGFVRPNHTPSSATANRPESKNISFGGSSNHAQPRPMAMPSFFKVGAESQENDTAPQPSWSGRATQRLSLEEGLKIQEEFVAEQDRLDSERKLREAEEQVREKAKRVALEAAVKGEARKAALVKEEARRAEERPPVVTQSQDRGQGSIREPFHDRSHIRHETTFSTLPDGGPVRSSDDGQLQQPSSSEHRLKQFSAPRQRPSTSYDPIATQLGSARGVHESGIETDQTLKEHGAGVRQQQQQPSASDPGLHNTSHRTTPLDSSLSQPGFGAADQLTTWQGLPRQKMEVESLPIVENLAQHSQYKRKDDDATVDGSFRRHQEQRSSQQQQRNEVMEHYRKAWQITGQPPSRSFRLTPFDPGNVENVNIEGEYPALVRMRCGRCGTDGKYALGATKCYGCRHRGYLVEAQAEDPHHNQFSGGSSSSRFGETERPPRIRHVHVMGDEDTPRLTRDVSQRSRSSLDDDQDDLPKRRGRFRAELDEADEERRSKRRSRAFRDEEDEGDEDLDHFPRRNPRRQWFDGGIGDDDALGLLSEWDDDAKRRRAAKRADRQKARSARERKVARAAQKASEAKTVELPEFVSVQNLGQALGVRYELFVRKLEQLGYDDIFPGKVFNAETSGMIAMEYDFEPVFPDAYGKAEGVDRDLTAAPELSAEDKEFLPTRPPVVTIMGHVDHGKTTILDYLRKSSIAAGEAGGITQHIGAFSVPMSSSGKVITFLDTPGHAAFLAMRQRGAHVTDIVILVVAADDSVKPQTLEAIKHARAAGVPMLVAVNKIDKTGADVQRVKQDLARHGVELEDFGGDTQVVPVSGTTGQGMDDLEENVVALSEFLDHRADPNSNVEGWVIEATTKKSGRVATVLIRRGTLRPGTVIVAGKTWARVRKLKNEAGVEIHEVGPGMPAEVEGWRDQPVAGDEVLQAPSEQKANSVIEHRMEVDERVRLAKDMEAINEARWLGRKQREKEREREANIGKATGHGSVPDHSATALAKPSPSKKQQEVHFVIKADVSGSAEALEAYVLTLANPMITPVILSSQVGQINETDVELAAIAKGHIIAFNLPAQEQLRGEAEARGVKVLSHNIIYRVLDDVKAVMEDLLPPLITQRVLGEAEVGAVFDIGIGGRRKMRIAGCKVRNGAIRKGSRVRVVRGEEQVYNGTIDSLKNVKKDVTEMRKDTECGVGFEDWQGFQVGDKVQTYEEKSEKRTL